MTLPTRRAFVATSLAAIGAPRILVAPRRPTRHDDVDRLIMAEMEAARIPGLAAAVIKSGRIAWSKGYGWADIGKRKPMDADRTIQNIGSVSKTVTATAVMQLVERNLLALDQDVSRYLPFPVRHPSHPSVPITCRLLLTHRSAIVDGPAYAATYACGDPTAELGAWLRDYLAPDGKLYRADTNFGAWAPGTRGQYCNIGFGLLGHLAERVSGEPFRAYTRRHIFEPLGLRQTGWLWSEIDPETHAVLYAPIGDPKDEELEQFRRYGLVAGGPEHHPTAGDFQPLCRYGFVTYPDGGLRTSVNQLARFLMAFMGGGEPVLRPATVRQMLTSIAEESPETGQGLAWRQSRVGADLRWGHNGADPGVRTSMAFRPSDGVGVIVFANRGHVEFNAIVDELFKAASRW
jgi:CubicO group peptidase (beta-lactamase class C family)